MRRAKTMDDDEPLFSGAKDAVRFALSVAGRAARPAMSRLLDSMLPSHEFSTFDLAAQAGMILNIVRRGGRFAMAVMTAAVAPRSSPCHCQRACCSGEVKNLEWRGAIRIIAEEAIAQGISRARYPLRLACVLKVFGEKISHRQIAEQFEIAEASVSKHYSAIRQWLRGSKASHGRPPEEGVETAIWRAAEDALRDASIVG